MYIKTWTPVFTKINTVALKLYVTKKTVLHTFFWGTSFHNIEPVYIKID